MYGASTRNTYAPRDLQVLRPPTTACTWRSVRRRQRRMYRAYSRPDSATPDHGTLVATVLVPSATPSSYLDAAVQTNAPTPTRSSIAIQTSADQHTSVATQTLTPSYTSASTQTAPTPVVSYAPLDDIWADGPPHDPTSLWGILDDPLPPPPPMPVPPRGFIRVPVPVEWGQRTNQIRPPAPRSEPARYSLAETTAQVIELMSPQYPSALHALVDYQHLPPFQRRALLELHRLLFPHGLDRTTFGACFTLLPLVPILFYIRSWESTMSFFVQDCSVPEDFNYQFKDGIFFRY